MTMMSEDKNTVKRKQKVHSHPDGQEKVRHASDEKFIQNNIK